MESTVKTAVNECLICQKVRLRAVKAPLCGTQMASGPWDVVAMDLIGPIKADPESTDEGDLRYIIVAIDLFTRWVEMRVLNSKSARSVNTFYIREIVCRHGQPKVIQTDQGGEFKSNASQAIHDLVESKVRLTTPYHPQANGCVERANQEVAKHMRTIVLGEGDVANWPLRLALVQRLCNTTVNRATGYAPYTLLMGLDSLPLQRAGDEGLIKLLASPLIKCIDSGVQGRGFDPYLKALQAQFKYDRTRAEVNQIAAYSHRMREAKESDYPPLAVGDWCWVFPHKGRAHKFCGNWLGPMKVLEIRHVVHVVVEAIDGATYPRHRNDVQPVRSSHTLTEEEVQSLARTDSIEQEIFSIGDFRYARKTAERSTWWSRLQFGINWVGWEDNTYYQFADTLGYDHPSLREFWKDHPDVVSRISPDLSEGSVVHLAKKRTRKGRKRVGQRRK